MIERGTERVRNIGGGRRNIVFYFLLSKDDRRLYFSVPFVADALRLFYFIFLTRGGEQGLAQSL